MRYLSPSLPTTKCSWLLDRAWLVTSKPHNWADINFLEFWSIQWRATSAAVSLHVFLSAARGVEFAGNSHTRKKPDLNICWFKSYFFFSCEHFKALLNGSYSPVDEQLCHQRVVGSSSVLSCSPTQHNIYAFHLISCVFQKICLITCPGKEERTAQPAAAELFGFLFG